MHRLGSVLALHSRGRNRQMLGRQIKAGMTVDGRKVRQAIDTFAPLWFNGKPAGTEPVRRVTFDDGSQADYRPDDAVQARGYVEQLPARNVPSRTGSATRVRASDPRWRGQGGDAHGTVRHIDFIAKVNMFDQRRVNGKVGINN